MKNTKIAIGTSDGLTVCDHLAHSSAFLIFEIEGNRAVSRSVRPRFSEACGNHASFVDLLEGCATVLCRGIGHGAADSLSARGIRPLVVVGQHTVDAALALYLEGKLATTDERVCLCH